jgi:hypothetical protein
MSNTEFLYGGRLPYGHELESRELIPNKVNPVSLRTLVYISGISAEFCSVTTKRHGSNN